MQSANSIMRLSVSPHHLCNHELATWLVDLAGYTGVWFVPH